jgi:uncharacterized SAM-binding protein YcdF (DUF218 family)
LVFTGGSGHLDHQDLREADYVGPFLHALGMDTTKVVFENESRNTYENAVFSKRLVQVTPGDSWILITSAFHMPRALGVFRQNGWTVIPDPVDYNTTGNMTLEPGFNLINGLENGAVALHEWLGLTFYYLTGRTNSFYPALASGLTDGANGGK